MKKDVFTIIIGGKAGQGTNKAGTVAAHLFSEMQREVFQMNDYPSLIRGGHNFSVVSSSTEKIRSHYMQADLIVALDKKSGKALEPTLEKAISLVEDPHEGISGPIRLKGGIPLESTDGKQYEIRNRVTICRCGESKNKPFCDTTHVYIKFHSNYKNE